jgi:hypothetical protein
VTTFIPQAASNGGVKLVWKNSVFPLIALAGFCFVAANVLHAQTTADTSSAIVSPKSAANDADGNIEPRKPSISETSDDVSISVDAASLLPDLPPVPRENATLVGGTIERLDHVRDRITVRLFGGGGKQTVLFDPRTQVLRGGKLASISDLREGERVYLDTILDGSTVFARTMRLDASRAAGESQGVVMRYRSDRGELTYRDSLSPDPVRVRITSATKVKQGDRSANVSALVPGSLISIGFTSDGTGHNTANEISILALPGTRYTFAGEVVHIDLRSGLLVLSSSTDHKTYEVYLSSSATPDDNLHPGANVTVVTNYDGSRYVVREISINLR